MPPTTRSKKAAESAAQACKAVADARTTAANMANLAATIADQIERLQADAEDSVFNKKMVEIQEQMKAQQVSSDKRFLETADQLKSLIEAIHLQADTTSNDTKTVIVNDPEKAAELLEISHAVNRAERKGEIPGYRKEIQWQWRQVEECVRLSRCLLWHCWLVVLGGAGFSWGVNQDGDFQTSPVCSLEHQQEENSLVPWEV